MSIHDLTAVLWREREILELLLFKLHEEQLLLLSGNSRWLNRSTTEIELATKLAREISLARTVESAVVGAEWGTTPEPTLQELRDAAPEGAWKDILTSHLAALVSLRDQIGEVKTANEKFLTAAARSTQETLAGGHSKAETYDARGLSAPRSVSTGLLDQEI